MALASASPSARAPFANSNSFGSYRKPSTSNHSVGFGLAPQSTLGFGFASSAPLPTSFGSPAFQPQPGPSTPSSTPSGSTALLGKRSASRRRRREDSSDEEGEDGDEEQQRAVRPLKKMRSPTAMFNLSALQPKPADDLVRQLGHLQKQELVSLLGSLVDQHPSLAADVQALMPRPSLDSFLTQLPHLESAILSVIPQQSRAEYVLSRAKLPLEAYVAECRLALQSLNVAAEHVSTSFTFLHALTASIQRLERALPPANPYLNSLIPNLFNAWHLFLSRISTSVNAQGKILGADFVQRMFDEVQQLCQPQLRLPGHQQQQSESERFMLGVGERLNKEIGWLASRRSRSNTVEMDEEL